MGALADGGVFDGAECAEAMLCPGEPIDRKTMAVWIVRALDGQDPAETADSRFSDVDAHSFHGPFIERMADLGVTAGCGDGTAFCLDGTVTRDQMAVFLTRAFELDPGPDPGFSDVAPDAWYHDHVAALAASNITAGCGDSIFCPHRHTTRAQMATFLYRALNRDDTQPDATNAYKAVTSGRQHDCAIGADDAITCWGFNSFGEADAPEGAYKAVSAGGNHSCAIGVDDAITCWGFNSFGEADAPEGAYKAVSVGGNHSCAIGVDDAITCWGFNASGRADAPVGAYKAVTAGHAHSCAIGS